MEGLDSLTDLGGKMGFLMNTIKESGGIDVFHLLVERTVQPVCVGKEINTEDEEAAKNEPAYQDQTEE